MKKIEIAKKIKKLEAEVATKLAVKNIDPYSNWEIISVAYQDSDPELSQFIHQTRLSVNALNSRLKFEIISS